jgi:hypothetical protein
MPRNTSRRRVFSRFALVLTLLPGAPALTWGAPLKPAPTQTYKNTSNQSEDGFQIATGTAPVSGVIRLPSNDPKKKGQVIAKVEIKPKDSRTRTDVLLDKAIPPGGKVEVTSNGGGLGAFTGKNTGNPDCPDFTPNNTPLVFTPPSNTSPVFQADPNLVIFGSDVDAANSSPDDPNPESWSFSTSELEWLTLLGIGTAGLFGCWLLKRWPSTSARRWGGR